METIASLLALVIVGILAVLALALLQRRAKADEWAYTATTPLTPIERKLYFRLREALPEHVILAQVQLSRFLQVTGTSRVQAARNRIDRKSIDFLVCARDFSVVAAIELDDASHERRRRQAADQVKTAALATAGVRLIRWPVKLMPDRSEIRMEVLQTWSGTLATGLKGDSKGRE